VLLREECISAGDNWIDAESGGGGEREMGGAGGPKKCDLRAAGRTNAAAATAAVAAVADCFVLYIPSSCPRMVHFDCRLSPLKT
jgi:hypothetical protein